MSLCFFPCRADEWVLKGISGYIYGLYLKKTFGVNEYRHWIKEELDRIVEYELKMGGVLLHPTFSGGKEKDKVQLWSGDTDLQKAGVPTASGSIGASTEQI
ncbi:Transcription initiation factor TFIID subunit 2 [Ataeniobius toweri]|uniref:Transcription initiation factor TFIID subunit 2 n=1 Tax=Ataeniobius toweri TaxID=208326 RepID=A0ABU7BH29_9TELE|nr:Transcription initiation factor TFIID subunit 2 [Ataeniobius toweri]